MITINVREFEEQPLEILRRMREEGQVIVITEQGKAIAHLVPVSRPAPSEGEMAAYFANLDQLTVKIRARWPEGVSALDAIHDVRREL